MTYLVGLDIGTSAVKALLCDTNGQVVATATRQCALVHPRPGWAELDMEGLWEAAAASIRQVVAQAPSEVGVAAMSFSVASGTTVLVGSDGEPLGRAISWMDTRAEAEIGELLPGIDLEEVYHVSGWPFTGMYPLGHLAWLRRHEPERLNAARHICLPNDFIQYRLAGRYMMDPSNAVTSILYDQAGARWHKPYLDAVGIDEDLLSPLANSGEVVGSLTPEAAGALGLSSDTLVINGAHDQYCAALGTGVLFPGEMVLSCGTAWVLFVPLCDRQVALDLELLVGPHLAPGVWGAMVDLYAFGQTPDWFLTELAGGARLGPDCYARFNEGAAAAPPGAHGVLFIPLGSGQTPYGAVMRLLPHHTHGDVSRALMEGLALEVRHQFERLAQSGVQVSDIKAVGGAMESPVWPHIIADVLQQPLTLLGGQATAALGAAMLAGTGAGAFADLASGISALGAPGRVVAPDPRNAQLYDKISGEYQRAVTALLSLSG